MRRAWSWRTRTTVTFALASMLLTAAVVAFVTVASLRAFTLELDGSAAVTPSGDAAATADQVGDAAVVVDVASLAAATQWRWAVVGVLVAGLLAGVVGWWVSRQVTRPVDRIATTARSISASTLHERVALEGPDDELRSLSRTIDALLDRLEAAFESQRRFVAQASHELRTPLSVQRAALQIDLADDAAPDEIAAVRAQLLEQNRRTEHLVEGLLVLAEAERGLGGRVAAVDLRALADEVVAEAGARAVAAGVTVTGPAGNAPPDAAPVVVDADPVLVRQVLVNLVDNALEYNVAGGTVDVGVDGTGLRVANTGPVVPDDVLPTLVEPFRRGGPAGTHRHSGLGLSIVAAVVRAHGWRLDVAARDGGGLVVGVRTA